MGEERGRSPIDQREMKTAERRGVIMEELERLSSEIGCLVMASEGVGKRLVPVLSAGIEPSKEIVGEEVKEGKKYTCQLANFIRNCRMQVGTVRRNIEAIENALEL